MNKREWEELLEIEINRNGQKAETSSIPILKHQEQEKTTNSTSETEHQ